MKTSERFTNAVTKLYNAFHNGELNAMDCQHCAVGNMCDNNSYWALNYKSNTGYSPKELEEIENVFMFGSKIIVGQRWSASEINQSKEHNKVFEALCAVVEYLCELEGIPNVMDYTCLFETENNEPVHKLETVFL